jgi:Xaa-Pro aminopeptidase
MADPVATRAARLRMLKARMASDGVVLTAIAPTDSLCYLLGFSPHPDERACMLLASATGAAILMPDLNAEQAITAVPELGLVRWTGEAGPAPALHAAMERLTLVNATEVVGPQREVKDARQPRPWRRSRPRCLDVRAAVDDARLCDRAAAGHGPQRRAQHLPAQPLGVRLDEIVNITTMAASASACCRARSTSSYEKG